tara:strand:+ start:1257 stop:1442 length:186 start_codon:yes stop_codon:yes gene_type:complete
MRVCRVCKKDIIKKNLIRNSAYGGYQNICRPCKSAESRKYALKKRELLKQSQYRSYWSDEE